MGDGQVLEHGTHAQLLADVEGPYARLVQAQKLREAEQRGEDFESESDDEKAAAQKQANAMEAAAEHEEPLGRANTSRSLASEILDQKRREQGAVKERTYGTLDMFRRMGTINKEAIPLYIVGCLAACGTGMVYPAFGIVYAQAIQDFQMTGHALRVAGKPTICLQAGTSLTDFSWQLTAVHSGSSSLLSARHSSSRSRTTCSTSPPQA